MLVYFLIGLLWCCFLEYYTTSKLDGPFGEPWLWSERLFHVIAWPFSFATFVYWAIKEFLKNNK